MEMKASTLSVWVAIAAVAVTLVVEMIGASTKAGAAAQRIVALEETKQITAVKLEKITDILANIQQSQARVEQKVDDIRVKH